MAIKLLLFALEKGYQELQLFRDSMLVINWVSEIHRCSNTQLGPLLVEIQILKIAVTLNSAHCFLIAQNFAIFPLELLPHS